MQCVTKIKIKQQLVKNCQMLWKPKVVVAQISHKPASRLAQGGVSMDFALPWTLGEIEEAKARLILR